MEIDNWLRQSMKDSVYWAESTMSRRFRRVTLSAAPIDVGPILREHLFQKTKTVIMTSATLATAGKFDFFKSRVGLTQTEVAGAGQPVRLREAGANHLAEGHARPDGEGRRSSRSGRSR